MTKNESIGAKALTFLLDNMVTLMFVIFVFVGFLVAEGMPFNFFLNELVARFFRNGFLVLALIIPVLAGLGLNFGIVVGALAGMMATIAVRFFAYHEGVNFTGGGIGGLMLCFLIALPLAILFGFLTGRLYNATRGQEMIASLIVGFFASGIYQFITLFSIGGIIPVPEGHRMIIPSGVGINATFDMGMHPTNPIFNPEYDSAGLSYALDWIWRVPFAWALLTVSLCILAFIVFNRWRAGKNPAIIKVKAWVFALYCLIGAVGAGVGAYAIAVPDSLFSKGIHPVPAVTGFVIIGLCLFTHYFTKTKLGQDCRSVGQSQHIANVSGINVDRTRIIATIISTVLGAWGMIIWMQNIGTVNTYGAHMQIGMFAVASLLVGGATTAKANVKNALIGVILFNAMFIVSPQIGLYFAGSAGVGEYTRSFMAYGVIALALGMYVWRSVKAARDKDRLE